jgi:signal transduction histidine kinase
MKLSGFITERVEDILSEWDSFAKTLLPAAASMTGLALRDHAQQILLAVAKDIETQQNPSQEYSKSRGMAPDLLLPESAAAIHGALRQSDGFTLLQLTAEFRALRACVLRLWLKQVGPLAEDTTSDMLRFNEAIDQALAESVSKYSLQVNRTRDMFLAILGHDLRAPLASISLSGELLTMPGVSADRVAAMGKQVQRSAATMSAMVNDLLGYSRTQLGSKIPIKAHLVDLAEVCNAAIDDVSAMYPGAKFNLEKAGNLTANLDDARLHQVFCNLLINAAHYGTKEHPITIVAKEESDTLVVQVNNRGPAIPAQSLQNIFNPLVQLSNAHSVDGRPATSLGLGLFIAREITEAHGGAIEVESSETDGTTFKVRLPKKAAQH